MKASHVLMKEAALSHPSEVRRASKLSCSLPSSPYTAVLLATQPTVMPSRLIKPVTISLAKSLFNSRKKLLSPRSSNAIAGSLISSAKSGTRRFKSSMHSSMPPISLLFSGRMLTRSRSSERRYSSPSQITSTTEAVFWKSAEAVSSLSA